MEPAKPVLRRCAIYTRKSSAAGQDGLRRWRDLGCARLMEDLGWKQVVKVHRLKGSGSACSSQKEPLAVVTAPIHSWSISERPGS